MLKKVKSALNSNAHIDKIPDHENADAATNPET